jgi:hypothetical protein
MANTCEQTERPGRVTALTPARRWRNRSEVVPAASPSTIYRRPESSVRFTVGGERRGVEPGALVEGLAVDPELLTDPQRRVAVAVDDGALASQPRLVVGRGTRYRGEEQQPAVAPDRGRDRQLARERSSQDSPPQRSRRGACVPTSDRGDGWAVHRSRWSRSISAGKARRGQDPQVGAASNGSLRWLWPQASESPTHVGVAPHGAPRPALHDAVSPAAARAHR